MEVIPHPSSVQGIAPNPVALLAKGSPQPRFHSPLFKNLTNLTLTTIHSVSKANDAACNYYYTTAMLFTPL